ncbi:MAG: hypothetical protein AB7O86_05685 [Porticoccaceae bacterium]
MIESIELLIEGINPQPWSAPTGSKSNFFSSDVLRDYKAAIRESIVEAFPDHPTFPKGELLTVEFYYSRSLAGGEHVADVTNMNKATEDALQRNTRAGFRGLYYDDKNNRRVTGEIVEQSREAELAILVRITPYRNFKTGIFGFARFQMPEGPPIPGNVRMVTRTREETP